MMDADLNQMMIFVKVVEQGSFIAASRALAMPKTTVSRKVAELEERLGVRLLERNARQIKLTMDGAVYLERCKRIAQQVEEADAIMINAHQSPKGTITIALPENNGALLIREIVERFLGTYPDIRAELVEYNPRFTLSEQGVDVGFLLSPFEAGSYETLAIGQVTQKLYASPRYIERFGEPKTVEDLQEHQCIDVINAEGSGLWKFYRDGEMQAHASDARIATSSIALARQAAIASMGIAILTDAFTYFDVKYSNLVQLLPDWHIGEQTVYAVYPPQGFTPLRVRALLKFLDIEVPKTN